MVKIYFTQSILQYTAQYHYVYDCLLYTRVGKSRDHTSLQLSVKQGISSHCNKISIENQKVNNHPYGHKAGTTLDDFSFNIWQTRPPHRGVAPLVSYLSDTKALKIKN